MLNSALVCHLLNTQSYRMLFYAINEIYFLQHSLFVFTVFEKSVPNDCPTLYELREEINLPLYSKVFWLKYYCNIAGSSWFIHLSLHCLPVRLLPVYSFSKFAITVQLGLFCGTNWARVWSSCRVHGSFGKPFNWLLIHL